MTILGAHTALHQDSTGTWNIARALNQRRFSPIDTVGVELPELVLPRFLVQRLSVEVTSEIVAQPNSPEPWLFPQRGSKYLIEEARVAMDWTSLSRQIDVIDVKGNVYPSQSKEPVEITRAAAQIVVRDDRIDVNDLQIGTRGSRLVAVGAITNYRGTDSLDTNVSVRLDAARIDSRELTALVPRQPFREPVGIVIDASGNRNDFVIHELEVAHADSRVSVTGLMEARGDSAYIDLVAQTQYLSILDVDALLPDRGFDRYYGLDSLAGDAFLQAALPFSLGLQDGFVAHLQSDVQSGAGGVLLTGTLRRTDGRTSYRANLAGADIDAAAASGGRLPPSLLTGNATISSSSLDLSEANGALDIDVRDSWYNGVRIDSLIASANAAGGRVEAGFELYPGAGSLAGNGTADFSAGAGSMFLRADLSADELDIGPMIKVDSVTTEIRGNAAVQWRTSPEARGGAATISLEPSLARHGHIGRTVPRSQTRANIVSDSSGTTVGVSGDLLQADFQSSIELGDLPVLAQVLVAVFRQNVEALLPGSFRATPGSGTADQRYVSALDYTSTAGTITLQADSSIIPLLTRQPVALVNSETHFDLTTSPLGAEFEVASAAAEASLAHRTLVRASLSLEGTMYRSLAGEDLRPNLAADLRADTLVNGRQIVSSPTASFSTGNNQIQTSFAATASESVGPIDVRLSAARRGPRWSAQFNTFDVAAKGYRLLLRGDHTIDLYRDAVAVDQLRLASPTPNEVDQLLLLDGTWSRFDSDTLSMRASRVDLERLSAFAGLRRTFSGTADGQAELVRINDVPVLAGRVDVTDLGLDGRVLGDFDLVSSFATRRGEVNVTANLVPPASSTATNDLALEGAIQFVDGSGLSSVVLDLGLAVHHADLFFFEYIFPHTIDEVEGHLTGTGGIGGTLARPVFTARLNLPSGTFRIPGFNLDLGVAGDVLVDEQRIGLASIVVSDPDGGTATITGDILFNDYRFFSLDLDGSLDDIQIMDIAHSTSLPFYGDIRGSGELTLEGPISGATLRTSNAITNAASEVFIPINAAVGTSDDSYIVFADSTGALPERRVSRRRNVLSGRPSGERTFLDGLALDLNLFAPPGSTVHLVIDPLLGDVINANGTGRLQIRRAGGEFSTFGSLEVNSGDYLFTAGDVFVRRFNIEAGGRISWDGDPTNAVLDIPASYETRASRAGLPGSDGSGPAIPLIVRLRITGRVEAPEVDLSLEVDRANRELLGNYAALEAILNQPRRSTEYATSVLVTNSFLLTTSEASTGVFASSAFNSVSQLVASQINRYLNEALPNVDFSFGVQGESTQELGVTYGIALRLLDEKLVIRGSGVYQGARTDATDVSSQSLEGEFVVEVRLSPNVSVEVFYRREGEVLTNNATLTGSTGAGVSYRTEFSSWRRFFSRLFGRKSTPVSTEQ